MNLLIVDKILKYKNTYYVVGDETFITLSQHMIGIIDTKDIDKVKHLRWHAVRSRRTFYAEHTSHPTKDTTVKIKMHRYLLNISDNRQVDHIDGRGLNNQRSNLRICTSKQNSQNRKTTNNSTGVVGVTMTKSGKFMARIFPDGKSITIGTFSTLKEATKARKDYEKKYYL